MFYFRITIATIILSAALSVLSHGQDYTHIWNAVKRVELGLDPAWHEGEQLVMPSMVVTDQRIFPSSNPQSENSLASCHQAGRETARDY
jgi:hypothetical protein